MDCPSYSEAGKGLCQGIMDTGAPLGFWPSLTFGLDDWVLIEDLDETGRRRGGCQNSDKGSIREDAPVVDDEELEGIEQIGRAHV